MQCVNNESGRFPHTSSCTSSSSNSNHHHHHHSHHPHRHDHNNNNHTSTSTSTQSPPPAPAPPLAPHQEQPHQEQPPPHEKQTHSSSSTLTTHSSSSSSRPSHPLPHIPSESGSDVKRASALTALSLQSDAVVDDSSDDDDDVITTHHLIADNSRVHDEYRVKVWLLSDDGHWTDDGTGHCLFKLVDSPPAQKYVDFRIFSESSSASSAPLLLHHTMHAHTLYDKQGESIIQWIETGDTAECEETRGEKCAREYAISFQHKSHCQRVWRLIAHLKGFARLSEFEQHVRLRRTKVSSTSPLVDDDGDGEDDGEGDGGDKMAMDAMDVDGNDDDDVDELLNTFLSDHVRVDDESHRGRNRDDMDINVTDEKLSRTASGTILENESGTDTTTAIGQNSQKMSKRKFRLKKKKTKTKKLKLKNQKFKTAALSSSDDDDDDEQDDDDDDDDRFLHKLNKRTLRKNKTPKQPQTQQHRQRLQIPLPTAHNLCHVYAAVRTATETCDVGAIDQLANRQWMCALYDVFVALEREQKQKQKMQNTPKEAETTTTTTAVDIDIDMFPERSEHTKCNDLSTPSKNGNGAHETENENEREQKTTTTTAMATTAWTASSLTPRLSCTSLSTLPPSVEDDPRDEYHALEFVFLIVLECCREHTLIKRHHPHHAATTAAATAANRVSAKFAEIGQQTPMFMHSLVASLLGSFGADARHGGNGGGTALCMLYLSKPWVAKTIAMLEYDPVRRRHLRHCSRNVPRTGTGTCPPLPPLPPPPPPLETPESVVPPEAYTSQIALSYKHRHFLRRAKPQRLSIPFSTDGDGDGEAEEAGAAGKGDGDTLYDEIEYLYLLTYARDVVLLGKLDLEQQAFHFLNHHVARYNQCVCECIVDDAAFLRAFLLQLKQSCCTHFGSDKIAAQDLKPALIARKSKSSTVSIHDTPPLTPQTSPGPNGDVDTKHKHANGVIGDRDDDVDDEQTETAMAMATTQMVHMEDTCRELGIDADDDDDDDDGYARALLRRRHNRHELFSAPNGVEFRFLSELLSRIKLVDVSARSALYADLLAAGLLDTLTACIQHCELLPTAQYAHIWLVAVEAVHHMMSGSLYTQTTPIRAQLCSQIDRLESADDPRGGDCGARRRPTLLQRLCAAFSATYECADDGILQQIYFVLVGVLGLGDALTLESAAQSSFYMGLHHPNHNRTQQNAQLMRIAAHFFRDCVPHFFDVLNHSNAEAQVQTRQKFVLRLLSACCEQELFVPLLKHVETEFSLLTCVEKLIFVPPSRAPSTGPTSSATSSTPPFSRSRVPNVDVSLCSIRFLRDTIHLSQHDVFWSDRLRSAHAFGRMMALFEANGVDTDNMLNSTILSVFASIEDKKIQDMVLYLGEEQILQTYDAKVAYTTLFGELLQLYEKARIGLSIATQLDDGSTATLSNCSSLSPRRELSPPNAAAAAASDAGDAHARRKRGYSLVADDGGGGAGGDREIHYLDGFDDDGADVGVKHGSKKEEQPVDTPRPARKERPATNASMSMSMSCGVSATGATATATAQAIYQDSPRPAAHGDGGDGGSRELRLPKRHKVDVEFDLLCNAKKKNKQSSPKPKLMSLRIAHGNGGHSKTDEENHEMDIKSGDGDGDGLFFQRRKNSKRKYEEMSPSHESNGDDDHRHHREHNGTSADYFSDRFEFAQTMSSSDGIHATFCDEIPPKKKAKLNGDRNGGSTSPHASPRPYLPLSPPSSILLNGADPADVEVSPPPKHVHFESNSAVQASQAQVQVQVRDTNHIETAHDRDHSTKENDDDGISSSSSPTTRSSAVCQT